MYRYPSLPQRIFYILVAVFLAYLSVGLCRAYFSSAVLPWGAEIFGGFLFNLYFTGVAAFSVFALPVERLLPDAYYHINRPKNLQRFAKNIGLEGFQRLLLATVWRKKEKQKDYFNGKSTGLAEFDTNTRKSEFGHLIPFILLCFVTVILVIFGHAVASLTTLLINIFFNFYPVILQRVHRIRIGRMRAILARRRKK